MARSKNKYSISEIVTDLQNNKIEILADVNDPVLLVKILSAAFPNDKPSFAFNLVIGDTYYGILPYHILDPKCTKCVAWDRHHFPSPKSHDKWHDNLKQRAIPDSKDHATIIPPGTVSLSNISKSK